MATIHIENYIKTEINKNKIIEQVKLLFPNTKKDENGNTIFEKEEIKFVNDHVFYYLNDKFYVFDKKFYNSLPPKCKVRRHYYILDSLPYYPTIIDEPYRETIVNTIRLTEAKRKFSTWFIDDNPDINYENTENLNNIRSQMISGKKLYEINSNRKINSNVCIDYWTFRGWDIETAKKKISIIQKNNIAKLNKKRLANPEWAKEISVRCIEYWLKKGYSQEEAKKQVYKYYNTFNREKCIEKYGEVEGLKRFKERQEKWQNTLKSRSDYVELIVKRQNRKAYSNISQELFDNVYDKIKHLNLNVYYAKLNHEYGIGIPVRGGCLYDFVITDLKYAIEFNGERFHPHKEILTDEEWKNWRAPYSKYTADEAYALDLEKNNALINKGFILDIIWEIDYKNNKEKIIDSIVNKILELYEKYKTTA